MPDEEAEKQRSSTDAVPMEAEKRRSSTDAMNKASELIKAAGAKSQEQLVKASSTITRAVEKKQMSKSLRNGWKETKDADGNVYYWNYWTRETTYSRERVGLHDKADDADHDADADPEDEGKTQMMQKVKEKVQDTAKASLEEVMETAFSNFTVELLTAKEEMESLMGDSGSGHQQRPSMDDLERYMKMKNSVLKKAQAELNAGEMAGKDALCTNCYPFEEWLNVEGVPKGACCICPPCAMCPIKCPVQVPCCFPLTILGVCRDPPLCFKYICPRNNPLCTVLGVPCKPVFDQLSKPAVVVHCRQPCTCPKCCECPTCFKTVGVDCTYLHCTFICCPVCLACCCEDEVLHRGNDHIYRLVNAPTENVTMSRDEVPLHV